MSKLSGKLSCKLSFDQLEPFYDQFAQQIDAVGRANESLFLSRLCMLLASQSSDPAATLQALTIAARGLDDEATATPPAGN